MPAPVSTLWSTCPDCGRPFDRGDDDAARCPECRPPVDRTAGKIMAETRRGSRQSRGYGAAWTRLSKRARRLQPWCSDCGTPRHLTTDHSPEAWRRHALGLPIRLEDVDVVCRRCNSERGPARGPDALERPTIGQSMDRLAALEDDMDDDVSLDPDDDAAGMDERAARGDL